MDHVAEIKRKRDLMQLRDMKEKMRTVLFQIAALERSKSDLQGPSVSPQSASLECSVSQVPVTGPIRSQEHVQCVPSRGTQNRERPQPAPHPACTDGDRQGDIRSRSARRSRRPAPPRGDLCGVESVRSCDAEHME